MTIKNLDIDKFVESATHLVNQSDFERLGKSEVQVQEIIVEDGKTYYLSIKIEEGKVGPSEENTGWKRLNMIKIH